MAYTRIHPIKATIQKSVDYISNPDKTDGEIYVSTYGCSRPTAECDFKGALSRSGEVNINLAYHLIQAFAPGEVSYDEAHKIGEELAEKFLGGKYSYVLATHIEKQHIHNHIIFCAADNIEHKKFNDCKQTLRDIRNISDQLCKEHGLSTITPKKNKSMSYNKWMESKGIPTFKQKLKTDIRECIKYSSDFPSFIQLMKAKGYEIKGEEFGENAAKYIAFKPLESTQFIRGCERTLGKGYTKEEIRDTIAGKATKRMNKQSKSQHADPVFINTNTDKFIDSPGLKRWADLKNLKLAASMYANAGTLTELDELIKSKNAVISETYKSISSLKSDIKLMSEAIMYAQEFIDNKPYFSRYKSVKNPDEWIQRGDNEMHYILYTGAETFLRKNGFDTGNINVEKLKQQLEEMKLKQSSLEASLHSVEDEVKGIEKSYSELQQYFHEEQHSKEQQERKTEPSL